MTASNAPRPYSRLETDDDLAARLMQSGFPMSGRLSGADLEKFAAARGTQRRIIWVTP